MELDTALRTIGSLAYASKMPCQTYSLPARRCITGSKLHEIEGSVCNKCYALRGNFVRPTIIACMERRLKAMDNPLWVDAMVVALKETETSGYFRWFASGDLQSLSHLIKICEVAKRLPQIKFWLPTKEKCVLEAFHAAGFAFPDNLTVRYSASMIEATPPKDLMARLGVTGSAVSKVAWDCPASKQDNECRDCRACWDKRRKVVTYKYH